MKILAAVLALLVCLVAPAAAQETIFNVPSGDVLERGKVYGELDFSYQHSTDIAGFTPRIVAGIGKRVETGVNVNGLTTGTDARTTLSPTVKWKAYDGGKNGWALLAGDDLFFPVQNRTYRAGNYVYAELTKSWAGGTRVTFGAYHFTRNVVAGAQRAGGQFAIEQPLNRRITLAADWFTGHHALGYVSPGIIAKLTSKLTWYGSYQIGNAEVSNGNHQLLLEIGWNVN